MTTPTPHAHAPGPDAAPTRAASAPDAPDAAPDAQLQLVTFRLDREEFALSILHVQEINRLMPITRVPHSPPFVEGVINLRGRILPVVDLRLRFGLEPSARGPQSRIVVAEVRQRIVGLIVDQVRQVLRVDRARIEPAPDLTAHAANSCIQAIARLDDRLLILLDLARLFDADELRDLGAQNSLTAA